MKEVKNSKHRFSRFLLYAFMFFHPVIFLNFYLAGSWYTFFHDYTLGMVFGIAGYCWLSLSLILSGRIKLLDRIIGQDRVIRLHGIYASSGIICGIVHFILKRSYIGEISLQSGTGIYSLVLFVLILFMTFLYMVEKPSFPIPGFMSFKKVILKAVRIDYSVMKIIHNLFPFIFIMLTVHVLLAYSTLENYLRISVMGGYGLVSVFIYFHHIILRKILPRKIHKAVIKSERISPEKYGVPVSGTSCRMLSVVSAENIAKSVTRIYMNFPCPAEPFVFKPGQFFYFRFFSECVGKEEHPFTVSSSPMEKGLSVTVKRAGNYTMRLAGLKDGDYAWVEGPYGLFTPAVDGGQKLFMAGGIGITPFLSVLKDWEIKGISFSAALLWSVKSENDITDMAVLERIKAGNPSFSFRVFVTGEKSAVYSNGRIGEDDIRESLYSGAVNDTDVYICGPLPFMYRARDLAVRAGVPKRNIYIENFSS